MYETQSGLERMFRMQEIIALHKLQCSHVEEGSRGTKVLEMCTGAARARQLALHQMQATQTES